MPIQAPQWTEYLSCPVCENAFELRSRLPISISSCGHTVCKACLSTLQRRQCPFDQCPIETPIEDLPVNTALVLLIDSGADLEKLRPSSSKDEDTSSYHQCITQLETLATHLRPVTSGNGSTTSTQLSRPMQRKLVSLINCQLLEPNGRSRAIKAARSLGERTVTELILQHQNPQQLSANLWAAVRARGCQFLGPAMQEEVLKLVLLALEDGSALSRKVLVMFVVQRLEPQFPQASKTSIGHVVQLLYRASCFKVTKRDGDSSLMQLKEEFRTYDALRREHDAQIVQIATEAGLRIAPDQWSSLLYGDPVHKSHMQSIIDKLQTPQSFVQSVQELVIALQRTGDPGHLTALRPHLDLLAAIEVNDSVYDWKVLSESLSSCCNVVSGLLAFITLHSNKRMVFEDSAGAGTANNNANSRYKTSMCRDLAIHGSCPRGKNCTFAHSMAEIETYRNKNQRTTIQPNVKQMTSPPPVAQVAPVPRNNGTSCPQPMQPQQASVISQPPPPAQTPSGVYNASMPVPPPPVAIVYHEMSPPAPDHIEELRRNQAPTPVDTQPAGSLTATRDEPIPEKTILVTKSLSALKSRKEQIIDTLEDIVGRDEMERVAEMTKERAKGGKSIGALSMAIHDGGTPNAEQTIGTVTSPILLTSTSVTTTEGYFAPSLEDEIVPWSDTPQVGRFGPISRRGTSITRPSKPSQTLAAMDDETNPTAVVRHSKQMSKQLPPTASLILQNGGRTALQPVAVGANGEIGYIAVAEPVAMAEPVAQVTPVPMQPPEPVPIAMQPQEAAQVDYVYAESERMKHELEMLQQKISNLNVAQQQHYQLMHHNQMLQQQQHQGQQLLQQTTPGQNGMPMGQPGGGVPTSFNSLTSELQLIEKTIRDREMELQINTCMQKESPQGLDYGSYIAHGLMDTARAPWERPLYNPTHPSASHAQLPPVPGGTGFLSTGNTNQMKKYY